MFKNVLNLKFKSMQIGSVNVKVNHHESFVEITYSSLVALPFVITLTSEIHYKKKEELKTKNLMKL